MESPDLLDVDDLTRYAREKLDRAYESGKIRRPRCSRDDFSAGYVAALVDLGVWSKFSEEAKERMNLPVHR